MASDEKTSALTNYTTPITTDFFPIVDITSGETKRIDFSLVQKPVSDIDYGGFDINNLGFLESNGANPASAGFIRMDSVDILAWQDSGDTYDLGLQITSNDQFELFNPIAQSILYITSSNTETIGDRMELRFKSGVNDQAMIRAEVITTGGARDSKLQIVPWQGGILTEYYRADAGSETNVFSKPVDVLGNNITNIQNLVYDISTSGTDVDFQEDQVQTISISANTTFTGTNYATGKSKTLYITTDATLRTLAFPAGWVFMGPTPADQAASKVGVLTLDCTSGVEAGVRAAYAVEE